MTVTTIATIAMITPITTSTWPRKAMIAPSAAPIVANTPAKTRMAATISTITSTTSSTSRIVPMLSMIVLNRSTILSQMPRKKPVMPSQICSRMFWFCWRSYSETRSPMPLDAWLMIPPCSARLSVTFWVSWSMPSWSLVCHSVSHSRSLLSSSVVTSVTVWRMAEALSVSAWPI